MDKDQLVALARRARCPRCDLNKTVGAALCRSCRSKLPSQMRAALEANTRHDSFTVSRALKAAANYFNVHFQSIRNFGGGRKP